MGDRYPYKVYHDGALLMEAAKKYRYPKQVELSMLDAGYTIRLNGKRITKTDLRKEANRRA